MSLPFLAALAAAALTPRHSGAIAQRHGSLRREAPLHRGALVPEFDNDSTLLKNVLHSCFKEHCSDTLQLLADLGEFNYHLPFQRPRRARSASLPDE